MMQNNNNYIKQLLKPEDSIEKAMGLIDEISGKCLFIIDEKRRLLGSLTDGDIRRSILAGSSFKNNVLNICNRDPHFIFENELEKDKINKIMKLNYLESLPILNKNKVILNIINNENINDNLIKKNEKMIGVPVVIMAGGLGTRLDPITKVIPKPLIPLGDSTIIETIIDKFINVGCSEFYASVNYKSKIMKAYFEDIEKNYDITFIDEKKPLGTAGSLHHLKGKVKKPFFVTNCDIIINTNYRVLYDFHIKNKFDLTLVAATKTYTVPYGTCSLNDDGDLLNISEKPTYEFLTNTGLYILNHDLLKFIPKNKFFHITELIENLKKQEKTIGVFPVSDDNWIDTGQLEDYKNYLSKFS